MKTNTNSNKTKLSSKLFEKEEAKIQKINALKLLARGMAHDINNILGAIEGYTSIIMDYTSHETPVFEDISEIRKAVDSATKITKQLATFSEKKDPLTEVSNLNETIDDLSQILEKYINKNIQLKKDLCENLPNSAIDKSKIQQALLNIIINAIEAINNNGKPGIIKIKTMYKKTSSLDKEPMIIVRVSDNGCGIENRNMNFILDPFFTTKTRGKGTGLGLSVAHSIIKRHKGYIEITSQLNKGSVFDIYLPTTNKPLSQTAKPALQIQKTKKRILLIEDDDNLRAVTNRALKLNGFIVFACASAAQAKKVFDENNGNFDIIFSDVILPDENGVKIANEFSVLNPKIKIIITSGYLEKTTEIEDLIKGRFEFVPKPYKLELLLKL
ncbi:MAG: response regulator, partial [Elusimicrobiales bacterium]|nr:response regulator [Elusimicrobiales bacterium]